MDDNDDALSKRATQERLLISKLTREDLEDKYLKIYDENILLKKHARKQEDRIKKMATKLIRLVNDKKKSLGGSSNVQVAAGGKRMRDVDTEEYVAELQSKVSDLELQNKRLKENLQISKVQLQTLQAQKTPVSTVYSNVTARIDTGLPKRDPSIARNMRTLSVTNVSGNLSARSVATSAYNNRQVQELEYLNNELRNRVDECEQQIDSLQEQLHQQQLAHDEAMYKLKNQVSQDHIQGVQENIDQIRLQRELKDKANQYSELYSKFNNLLQQHGQLKDNHDRLLEEIERYNQHLKQEQQRNISLKTELKNVSQINREILELRERVEDLNRENEILKEANQKLLNSAFSLEREREFRERERSLKIQIAQLEATLKADVGEKGAILDRLTNEKEQYDKLHSDNKNMQIQYYEMKQKYDEMSEKMQFLSKESNIDFSEIEEALIMVREKRSRRNTNDEFLNKVDAEKVKILQRKLVDLEAQLAETVGELDKSRHLLITQVKINDDYKKEVHLIQGKMEENKAEFDTKMLEYAQLLDLRAARIKKLERQLKDIAYGTKQVRVGLEDLGPVEVSGKRRGSFSFVGAPSAEHLDHQLITNLERGQNIFEIHLTRLVFTDEALQLMNETDPSTFCTIEFFEHELQTTPIVKGQRPEYNFTSQYIIKVDDFFLHYLQKEKTTIELHQAIGSDYETRAVCQLSFRELIDKQVSRIHGSARLICVNSNNVGVNVGTIEYWARLIVPVDEAFRLYKERTKALGYLASNLKAAQQSDLKAGPLAQKQKSADNMNELNINILRCAKLSAFDKKKQPSPYCVYKFYDFNDHDTEIINSSNFPEFNDHKSFAIPMDIDLDKYLKKGSLDVYVFDDNDPEDAAQYLGMAKIPLIALAHDKDIKGTFELKRGDGSSNGTIDITLYWQYSYLPPAASTFAPTGSKQPTSSNAAKNEQSSISLMEGERMEDAKSLAEKAKKMGIKLPSKPQKSNEPERRQNETGIGGKKPLSKPNSKATSPTDKSPKQLDDDLYPSVSKLSRNDVKRDSVVSNNSVGNATLHQLPEKLPSLNNGKNGGGNGSNSPVERPPSAVPSHTPSPNPHYNDTMFGDEPARTYSPTELDSLRQVYQTNVTNQSDDEKDFRESKEENSAGNNEDEIEEDLGHDNDETENTKDDNFRNYNATTRSEDDSVVVGDRNSWDPHGTSHLPKEGDRDNVIIEISNFSFKENSQILKREEIQRLFVGMEFLNYDPGDLECERSMPKPLANQPVHFNFRKIFPVDSKNNLDKREELAKMLMDKNYSFIRLAVVSEPANQDEDCEDIGYAFVDINDILDSNKNYLDKEIALIDANNEKLVIGKMVVTVEILDALNAIKNEINNSLEQTI